MNLSDLQSRTLAPGLDSLAATQGVPGRQGLPSISGNTLLGLDVWAGSSAAERSLSRPGPAVGGTLDQIVGHILAPLG
ncbi:hypothetical protein ASG87_17830 [Frateuria sp. Soil773]|uniref:hypothetical protein n=1 Tax=Frateuria sp. Soil773 TaxID=1736407 RepID=UPI0006F4E157|nr:hypothetical protein [Frateuria sp. Soil773]KRE94462.1 hypothetical protein ASG87_17830 [Frateuria sp. Soil773]